MSRRSSVADDDDQSIIDVFDFDDSDTDKWLCSTSSTRRSGSKSKIADLDAWLKEDLTDLESGSIDNEGKKLVDTRTFTRGKRRSFRPNFNGFDDKTQAFDNTSRINHHRGDNIPMMLRPKSNQVLSALLSESPTSLQSQTSTDAFLSMACSKEAMNSVISDSNEIDLNHLLMNVSQPSLLYSSIISDGKEESFHNSASGSLADSQILSDSMMEASMFREVQDSVLITEFLKHNDTVAVQDRTIFKNSTFGITDDCSKTFLHSISSDKTLVKSNDFSELEESVQKDVLTRNDDTRILDDLNITHEISSTEFKNHTNGALDSRTFSQTNYINTDLPRPSLNSTFEISNSNQPKNLTKSGANVDQSSDTFQEEPNLNSTFQICSSKGFNRISMNNNENYTVKMNTTFNAVSSTLREELLREVQQCNKICDESNSTPVNESNNPNSTFVQYDHTKVGQVDNKISPLDGTFIKSVTKDENELQNSHQNLDATFNINSNYKRSTLSQNIPSSQIKNNGSNTNYFTYKKCNAKSSLLKQTDHTSVDAECLSNTVNLKMNSNKESLNNRIGRFSTFIKKPAPIQSKITSENNSESKKTDVNFTKPSNPVLRKLPAPKTLSKLPQVFQKSNSNIGAISKGSCYSEDAQKSSQTTIDRYSLNKFKSGSDQKLHQVRQSLAFPLNAATSNSLENLGNSRNASNKFLINKQFKAADNDKCTKNSTGISNQNADKKLERSTPKVKEHTVLENTWILEEDLPSPILKNKAKIRTASCESLSPTQSIEFGVKTSSPLNDGLCDSNKESDVKSEGIIESIKENIHLDNEQKKSTVNNINNGVQSTRALRLPTNYTGTKPNVVSGIPRPASRIPAPRFSRPTAK